GIYVKGQHYDPNLFALDQDLLLNEPPARESIRLVERSADGRVAGEAEAVIGNLQGLESAEWSELGAVESFTAETLYEKINGRAEQYLAYDVEGMEFVALVAQDGVFIDVFVYDMGAVKNAFGIYAVERPEDATVEELGRQGYRVESSYFFWKGNYYAQIIASDISEEVRLAAAAIARKVEERLKGSGAEVWGLQAFPLEDRVAVQYYKLNALSLDFLRETYTAQYQRDGEEWTAFIAQHEGEEQAAATMEQYLAYLSEYGEVAAPRQVDGVDVFTGDLGGFYDVVFRKGKFFAGVNLVEGQELAERAADELLRTLE
ncbi:MAG: hypothetical protein ACI8PG_004862, partial [Planctomycetota bacterium]